MGFSILAKVNTEIEASKASRQGLIAVFLILIGGAIAFASGKLPQEAQVGTAIYLGIFLLLGIGIYKKITAAAAISLLIYLGIQGYNYSQGQGFWAPGVIIISLLFANSIRGAQAISRLRQAPQSKAA